MTSVKPSSTPSWRPVASGGISLLCCIWKIFLYPKFTCPWVAQLPCSQHGLGIYPAHWAGDKKGPVRSSIRQPEKDTGIWRVVPGSRYWTEGPFPGMWLHDLQPCPWLGKVFCSGFRWTFPSSKEITALGLLHLYGTTTGIPVLNKWNCAICQLRVDRPATEIWARTPGSESPSQPSLCCETLLPTQAGLTPLIFRVLDSEKMQSM